MKIIRKIISFSFGVSTLFFISNPITSHELKIGEYHYYTGLGIAASYCSTCHNIGHLGPITLAGPRGPRFETFSKGKEVNDLIKYLNSVKKSHRKRMPPLGLNDEQIKFLSVYMSIYFN